MTHSNVAAGPQPGILKLSFEWMIDSSKRSLQVSFGVKGAKLGLRAENSGPAQRTLTVRDLSKLVWEQKTLSLPRKISGSTSKLSWRQKTFNLPRNTPKGGCGSLASRQNESPGSASRFYPRESSLPLWSMADRWGYRVCASLQRLYAGYFAFLAYGVASMVAVLQGLAEWHVTI